MELVQAKVVLALIQEGTMSAAAERLGVTQPAVSTSLATLEREIGAPLFHRTRRGLSLTEHGSRILPQITELIRLSEYITKSASERSTSSGVVRIAGRQGFMQYVFPDLVLRLKKRMPEIHIERAYAEDQERSVQYLRSGLVDLAFAASPKIKSIHSDVFYRDPVLLAVSHTHPLAKKKHIIPSDLKHIPLCLPIRADRLRSPMNEFLKMIGTKINIILETNDYTLMRNLIEKDHCAGFVYLHNMITEDRESGIVPLRIPELSIIRDLTILYRRDDIAPHVERTKDVLIEEAKIILDKTKKRLRIL